MATLDGARLQSAVQVRRAWGLTCPVQTAYWMAPLQPWDAPQLPQVTGSATWQLQRPHLRGERGSASPLERAARIDRLHVMRHAGKTLVAPSTPWTDRHHPVGALVPGTSLTWRHASLELQRRVRPAARVTTARGT
ncbi:MAG: hypothetical protein IPL61_20645 [Myxococcales bacterium]|nr:hypothetical protein [Myxococcales bacterium]